MSIKIGNVQQEKIQQTQQASAAEPYMNCIFGQTNPIKNEKTNVSKKEELYIKASQLDDGVREKFLEYLEKGEPERDFIDYLNERYEKKQAEFEAAWAEYQEAKDAMKFMEKIYQILANKYRNTDSDYEKGIVAKAYRNKMDTSCLADMLLGKAGDIAHRLV